MTKPLQPTGSDVNGGGAQGLAPTLLFLKIALGAITYSSL